MFKYKYKLLLLVTISFNSFSADKDNKIYTQEEIRYLIESDIKLKEKKEFINGLIQNFYEDNNQAISINDIKTHINKSCNYYKKIYLGPRFR